MSVLGYFYFLRFFHLNFNRETLSEREMDL